MTGAVNALLAGLVLLVTGVWARGDGVVGGCFWEFLLPFFEESFLVGGGAGVVEGGGGCCWIVVAGGSATGGGGVSSAISLPLRFLP